jgi:hypothetical protein
MFGSTVLGALVFGSTVFCSTVIGAFAFGSTVFGALAFGARSARRLPAAQPCHLKKHLRPLYAKFSII